jgi:hypothetical protein
MTNRNKAKYQQWRRERGMPDGTPDTPDTTKAFLDETPTASWDAPIPGGSAPAPGGAMKPPAPTPEPGGAMRPAAPPPAPAPSMMDPLPPQGAINDMRRPDFYGRGLNTRMNLEADLANPNVNVVNRMAGRTAGGRGESWAAWGTAPKPNGVTGTPSDAPPMVSTSAGMTGRPPPMPPQEPPPGMAGGQIPVAMREPLRKPLTGPPVGDQSPSNVQSEMAGIPAADRIQIAMLRNSKGTEAMKRFNAVAGKYNMPQIPIKSDLAERRRIQATGGDWVPDGRGGMGNRMTGELNAPPAEAQPVKERLVQDGSGRWFDPTTKQYVTPEVPEKFSMVDGQLVGDRGTLKGQRDKKLQARGDGTFLDPETQQIVGKPTADSQFKSAGVPGLFLDTTTGKYVGKDMRPVKDSVLFDDKTGFAVNLNTGERTDIRGGQNIRDDYQGAIVKKTSGKVRTTTADGKTTEEPAEVGFIGFWNNEASRYEWKPAQIGEAMTMPGGNVMEFKRARDFTGLTEYEDRRPAGSAPAAPASPAAPAPQTAKAAGTVAPIGTIATDKAGKKMKKVAEGKWEPVV